MNLVGRSVCRLVGWLVGWSVGWSIDGLVGRFLGNTQVVNVMYFFKKTLEKGHLLKKNIFYHSVTYNTL